MLIIEVTAWFSEWEARTHCKNDSTASGARGDSTTQSEVSQKQIYGNITGNWSIRGILKRSPKNNGEKRRRAFGYLDTT